MTEKELAGLYMAIAYVIPGILLFGAIIVTHLMSWWGGDDSALYQFGDHSGDYVIISIIWPLTAIVLIVKLIYSICGYVSTIRNKHVERLRAREKEGNKC